MDKLYNENRENNIGIIACTNGGSFTPDTKFGGFTLAVPQRMAIFLMAGTAIQDSPKQRD